MGYKPTLGGLKVLQNYLKNTGFDTPVFKIGIYEDATPHPFHDMPGEGTTKSLDELIRMYGPKKEILDCRLESDNKNFFLQFTALCHVGQFTAIRAKEEGEDCIIEIAKNKSFGDFMEKDCETILNLARWGKEKVNFMDELKWFFGYYQFPELGQTTLNEDMILVYSATPSRLASKKNEICDYIIKQGKVPFHPFYAFPYEFYEGHPKVGREKTMKICLKSIDNCDEFWLFGVSKGTLEELIHAIKIMKKIKLCMDEFDSEWRRVYKELGSQYGNPLEKLVKGF